MWVIRSQSHENLEVELAIHSAKFNKRNVICDLNANYVTAGMKDVPGANGSPNSIVLQGQWQAAIVKEDSTWYCEDGKLVLDIRKRVEGIWNILIRCGLNGDDALIDPLSRVILGLTAAETHNYEYALQCFQRSADEGSWNAMRKLAALYSTNSEDNFPNVEKNAEKSISYVRMGAEQPWNSDAQFILSHAYLSGFGVKQDISQYIHYLQQATMLEKHSYAMFEMAENLLSGKHVSRDPLRAVHLLKKASSGGHSVATWTLGQLLITGHDGVQQDVDMGRQYVAAALNAEPTIAKKVFVPYTGESQLQKPFSATSQPAHHAALVTEAAAKAQMPTPLLRSRLSQVSLYAAAVVGVALVAAFMSSRMRRK